MIFKMRKPQDNEIVTLFFLPDKSVFDKFRRMTELAEYRANGYMCSGFTCVDKETYLNARLNETVKDFCENEEYRRDVLDRHSRGLLSETVFFETMRLIDDYKWTCLKKLSMQVRRLVRDDYEVQNEIAIQLYDAMNGRNSVALGGVR